MSILQAKGLSLRYAHERPLFANVDFELNPGDRVAVVGPNGAGKSSLLRILAGDLAPDAGSLIRRRGLLVASFHQSSNDESELADWDIEPALRGLGFDTDDLYRPFSQLSAGQRSRARLARALTQPADVLLLDEPTNHLDAKARAWLEHHLLRTERAVLFVSHDDAFLDKLATRVFALKRGDFRAFTGTWQDYQQRAQQIDAANWATYDSEQRRLAAWERAARQRESIVARLEDTPPGCGAAKAFYGHKAAKVARTARMLRERIPDASRAQKPWEEQAIPKLDFLHFTRSGDPPVDLQNLTLTYGETNVVENLNLTVRRGERWAILGPNGCGKTTIFRAIRGELAPNRGAVQIARNVKIGYFAQEAETLAPTDTPLEACRRECPDRTWVQTIFACLKLPREYAEVPIGQLSLGERAKTALAQILVSGANVLLLDEPTNHLEIEARHALTETLLQFPGTILFTSHDEAFIEAIATGTFSPCGPLS